ncbi:MbtH family protein [Kitasatospora misakiensis]|uniref:MbtH family protein n=1 Tax=Kitasatospora misakiensis TaxID=67330 RepID=A0ABW0XAW7_9ACTN
MNEAQTHTTVINDEEQYSVWPVHLELPSGWRPIGPKGTKAECLSYIEEVWTDMRPASLRAAMAANGAR